MKVKGFTLLEMLVAMAIFAALGVMTSQLVTRIVALDEKAVERGDRILDIQQAMQILDRDLAQIIHRPIRDEFGDPKPSTLIGNDYLLQFTRQGWRNPLERPRSKLQRVAYFVEDESLYRYFWHVLDRADDSEPTIQLLLDKVSSVEFSALDETGAEHSFWPVTDVTTDNTGPGLRALTLNIDITPIGEINRIWAIPAGFVQPVRSPVSPGGNDNGTNDSAGESQADDDNAE